MRRAAKIDANHTEVAAAFTKLGCSVRSLAAVGGGMPDLIVATAGPTRVTTTLVEIKDGAKSPSRRKLTPAQEKFRATWIGVILYVDSVSDVPAIVKAMRG